MSRRRRVAPSSAASTGVAPTDPVVVDERQRGRSGLPVLLMLKRSGVFNPGETAGVEAEEAEFLVERGVARYTLRSEFDSRQRFIGEKPAPAA